MSSVSDLKDKESPTKSAGTAKPPRANPVALEVPVSVTGARPATANEKRELFSEETNTVLVFKDGAVIGLSAGVAVGQLLFLTDKRTKREVVCQVIHKRAYRPTSCYVELEFTEPANDFWGVAFPTADQPAELPAAAEALEAAEMTKDTEESPPVEAPKTEDVAQLRDEVEALRAQLRELKEQQAAEERRQREEEQRREEERRLAEREAEARRQAEEEARRLAQREAEARRLAEEEAREKDKSGLDAREWERQAIEAEAARKKAEAERKAQEEAEASDKDAAEKAAKRAKIGMKLPSAAPSTLSLPEPEPAKKLPAPPALPDAETQAINDLLPKPALDFSNAPGLDPNDPYNIYKPIRKGPGKKELFAGVGLLVLLVGGGAAAWYTNHLPFFPRKAKTEAEAKASAPATSATAPAGGAESGSRPAAGGAENSKADSGTGSGTNSGTNSGNPPAAGAAEAKPLNGGEVPTEAGASKPAGPPPPSKAEAQNSGKSPAKGAGNRSAPKKELTAKEAAARRAKAATSTESKPEPAADVVPSDAPVIAAKLLHSVPPVYPPDAMLNYITGDVRIEADVQPNGRVGAMKVLVGPPALRQAAMDALKQYEYAPATQGGKPVVSKVTVTIKFWFNP